VAGTPDVNVEYTYWVAPTCPDNTAATSYQTTSLPTLDNVWLWAWNVRIPPGHAGYTGIALIDSGLFIIPWSAGGPAWLIGDDDDLTFPYNKQTGATVQLAYYNTSTDYSHGWQCRFLYTPISVLVDSGSGSITIDPAAWAAAIEATTGGS
jgi:hypothetical protein